MAKPRNNTAPRYRGEELVVSIWIDESFIIFPLHKIRNQLDYSFLSCTYKVLSIPQKGRLEGIWLDLGQLQVQRKGSNYI